MVVAGLLALSLTAVPLTAWAQAGWYYIPSLSLYEEFDDNIFSSTNRTSDFITRLSNGWKIGYRSRPFTLLLTSSLDGELFANHHELDGLNRTQAGLESEWIPTLPLTLRLSALFTKTQTPSELAPNLGLQLGRRDSTQLSLASSAVYRFDLRTSTELAYSYLQSESEGVTSTTHEPRLRLVERLSHVDTGTLTYALRLTESESNGAGNSNTGAGNSNTGAGNSSTLSHIVTLGWNRRLSATTSVTLEAGPRITGSQLGAEVNAGVSHRFFRLVDASLGYSRSSSPIIGQTGTSDTQALSGHLSMEPLRSFRVVFGAILSQVSTDRSDTTTEGAEVAASYRMTKWLSAVARYRFSHSETDSTAIFHNIFTIGLEASYPIRVD